jgi:hypothetical protein
MEIEYVFNVILTLLILNVTVSVKIVIDSKIEINIFK